MHREPRSTRARRGRRRAGRGERGAALVEFALVSTLLFTILFGTIEFGFTFFQLNDIRHGAREATRLVAVNNTVTSTRVTGSTWTAYTKGMQLAQVACERMDDSTGVSIHIFLNDANGNTVYDVGEDAKVIAFKTLKQYTKIFDPFLGGVQLREEIITRLEQTVDKATETINGTKHNCV